MLHLFYLLVGFEARGEFLEVSLSQFLVLLFNEGEGEVQNTPRRVEVQRVPAILQRAARLGRWKDILFEGEVNGITNDTLPMSSLPVA